MLRRKIAASFLIIAGLLAAAPGPLPAGARRPPLPGEPFTSVMDGRIRPGREYYLIESTPCLGLGEIQKLFGGRQAWERVSRSFAYERAGKRAEFVLGSATATLQGRAVMMDLPATWWSGQPYVPLSFLLTREFQEFTETTVQWEAATRTLTVETVPGISSPRLYSYPDKSRVVLELGSRVHHRVMGVRGQEMTIRFFGGRARSRERLEVKDGLLESVELAPRQRSSDFIVTWAETAGEPRLRLEESPRQLVVEVTRREAPEEDEDPVFTPPVEPDAALPALEAPAARKPLPSPLLALSPIKTIVIDAGHGGKDAGAAGPHGTLEKNINLAMARALARVLEREGRFNVVMTRQDDTFIPLQERTEIANRVKADLFISLHCNAGFTRASSGFEVYFLSEKATDDAAAAVARRENAVVELEGLAGKAREKLSELLWSLARTETMNEASELAALMNQNVRKRVGIQSRGVKQAGFYVLKGANMPAVLVEMAFITHPKEEGLLRTSRFQNKLADALYGGLLDYEKRKIHAPGAKTVEAEGGN